MAKVRPVKPRPKKSEAPVRKQPAAVARRSAEAKARQKQAAAAPVEALEPDLDADIDPDDEMSAAERGALCRSCGKRPGRPTAILGQMTQAELCPQCTALRKERIRLNRAAARGMRSSRLF